MPLQLKWKINDYFLKLISFQVTFCQDNYCLCTQAKKKERRNQYSSFLLSHKETFLYLCNMERKIIAYKHYFSEFVNSLKAEEVKKLRYVLDMLKMNNRISAKFVKPIKEGLYELRTEYNSNAYRVFFIFDEGNIVILFNGFQKKTQKTPKNEIEKALRLKKEYYEAKGNK